MQIRHFIPALTLVLLSQTALPAAAADADEAPKSKPAAVAAKTGNAIQRGATRAGNAVARGARKTGNAIGRGATKTGKAIERGATRTSNGVKRGAAKVGLPPAEKAPPKG